MRRVALLLSNVCLIALLLLQTSCASSGTERAGFWIDMYDGEPLPESEVLDDLADARVVYVGERHTVQRHHDLQLRVVDDLVARGRSLVLGLEQMERYQQPALDRYWKGEIDFDALAVETDWAERWSNYEQYRPILEAARASGAPILALNAKSETVRAVARQGIDGLTPEQRAKLPDEILLDQPMYEEHMRQVMMVHAHVSEEMLTRMFQAQVSRDETMAATLADFLLSETGRDRMAVVLCGSGHVAQAMGIPTRVRLRMPGVKDRILVVSGSGDVELSSAMKAMTRHITVTHEQRRQLAVPLADYLHVTELKAEPDGE